MKKSGILLLVVVSLFSLSIGPFVADTHATTPPSIPLDDTVWMVGGNFTAAIKFPNYVELSVKLPKLDTFWNNFGFGEVFAFNGDRTFQGLLLSLMSMLGSDTEIPMPTWSQNGANFYINIDQFSLALQDTLKTALGDLGTVELTATKPPSFSGKVDSRGTSISGKMAINYNVSIELGDMGFPPIDGTLSLTMSFKGLPYYTSSAASARATFDSASSTVWTKANSEGASRVFSIIKSAISEIKALAPSRGFNLIKSH